MGKKYVFENISEQLHHWDIKEGVVYICEPEQYAMLRCPCGCGTMLFLNLIPNTHPGWTITGNTIKPSMNRTIGCRSHFSITNGITH